ncbi:MULTISPECIES: fimbrial protein [Enterobacterales]|uniref:fimbrial protein n=1 Tax=Enterobacterales TaxID=91347 RepID=UPI002ED9F257
MKVVSLLKCLPGFMLMISSTSWAYNTEDSVQVEVTGSIKASPCTVIWPPNAFNLGLYLASDLNRAGPGGNTQTKSVNIEFINCPMGTNQVGITFMGQPVADSGFESLLFANNLTGEDATSDVGLQLFYKPAQGGTQSIGPGDEYKSVQLDVVNQTAVLNFYARMYTMHGLATPGKFSATVTMNVSYQ